jgi:hypothetical protein
LSDLKANEQVLVIGKLIQVDKVRKVRFGKAMPDLKVIATVELVESIAAKSRGRIS